MTTNIRRRLAKLEQTLPDPDAVLLLATFDGQRLGKVNGAWVPVGEDAKRSPYCKTYLFDPRGDMA